MILTPSVEQRYHTDAMFRHLVDSLYAAIHNCQYTPSELREAAILASIMHEERNIRRRYYFSDEVKP